MRLIPGDETVDFEDESGRLVGRYVYRNEFKPYLHPVNTPAGHTLTLSMPHDHRHHRGVMYALSAADVNFWEEREVRPGEKVGIQKHLGFASFVEAGDQVGFEQSVLWTSRDGVLPTFSEARSLTCESNPDGSGNTWNWKARLEALRDVRLIQSHWSHRAADGRTINYHGLGIRFRREFGGVFQGTTLLLDGVETDFADALGQVPRETTFIGTIDGYENPPGAGLTIRQDRQDALFATKDPFPLVCLGPSNAGPVNLEKGDTITCGYELLAFDGATSPDRGTRAG